MCPVCREDMFHLIHAHTIDSFTRTENNNFNPDFRARNNYKTLRDLACAITEILMLVGVGGPRVVVSTAAFHARVRGSVPGLGGLKETKLFLPHPRVKVSIVGSLCDREVACSASDRQGSNFESCVWRTVSSQSSHHPQEVLLAQFSLYVHKGGLKPDSFHFFRGRGNEALHLKKITQVVSYSKLLIFVYFKTKLFVDIDVYSHISFPITVI